MKGIKPRYIIGLTRRLIGVDRPWLRLVVDRRAALLIETMVAASIMTTLSIVTLAGLSTTQTARVIVESQAETEFLARNQMEAIFQRAFKAPSLTSTVSYTSVTNTKSGYTVTNTVQPITAASTDAKISKIVVTIARDGVTLLELETIRAND